MDSTNLNEHILDRKTPPRTMPLKKITLPPFSNTTLSNGIPVYFLHFGTVDVIDIQVVFKAGKVYQAKAGQASFMTRNMAEGTTNYSSLELAQSLDNFGAWIDPSSGSEFISVSLATLTRHIESTIPLLKEITFTPTFPISEFEKMKQRTLEKMKINAQKTTNIALKNYSELFYGSSHPYGSYFGDAELEQLEREDLLSYFDQFIYPGNFKLLVVGKFDEDAILKMLEENFGGMELKPKMSQPSPAINAVPRLVTGRHYIEKEGMQATLRLGHRAVPFGHPDYYPLLVMNMIFGGYFGSRLMKNIREEKGYTYGIYSGISSQKYDGQFVVQSDVGNEYIEPTIMEIKKEMHKLMNDGVGEEELDLVKNYLLGQAIGQRETPFQMANILRFAIENELSFSDIDRKLEIYQNITTTEIQDLAQKYLRPDEMLEVVVGKM